MTAKSTFIKNRSWIFPFLMMLLLHALLVVTIFCEDLGAWTAYLQKPLGFFLLGTDVACFAILGASRLNQRGYLRKFARGKSNRSQGQKMFRSIIEHGSEFILLFEASGRLLYVSPSACNRLGYSNGQLIGSLFTDLIHPDQKAAMQAIIAALLQKTGKSVPHANILRHRSGGTVWVEGTITNLLEDENVGAIVSNYRDVTERMIAERGELELQERFKAIFNLSTDAILLFDDQGKYVQANSAAVNMLGYPQQELLTLSFRDVLAIDVNDFSWAEFKQSGAQIGQVSLTRKDGQRITCDFKATPNILPGLHLSILTDVTERKAAEDELKRSESRLADAQRLAQFGNWELNLESSLVSWSDELYRIFDISPADFSHTFEGFIGLLSPESAQTATTIWHQLLMEGGSFDVEYSFTTKGGEDRYVHVIGHAEADASGKIVRHFGTAQNITARKKWEVAIKESATKYRLLFEHNPMPMWLVEKESLRFLAINEAALHHYGYTREEFLFMRSGDLKTPDERERFETFSRTAPPGPINAGIWKHKKKNGRIVSVEILLHQIIYDEHNAFLVLANDVTGKLRAEADLKVSYEQLKALTTHLQRIREEERSRIALEIHDELGQQLTSLKMDASWISRKLITADKTIFQRISGMIILIEETVRTVKRISSELRPGILDDLGLVAALEWQSQEFWKRTGVQCSFHSSIADAEPERNLATNIFRVYQEALTNVARHSMATRVETTLAMKAGALTLTITDNGRGFDPEDVKSKKSLGLVGMQERANNFNGVLKINSEAGRGTTIVLEVPYLKREESL